MQRTLQLLDHHHRGLLPAILTLAARKEQELPRLSRADLDTVINLLDLPADTGVQIAAVQSIGPEKALALLEEVLRQPRVPAPGYPYIVHAYQEQHIDGVTWLLEEVRIWLTGVTVSSSMWTAWPPETPIPDRGPPPAIRWTGFAEIHDDFGTKYTQLGGFLGGPHQPAIVSSSGRTTMPRATQMTHTLRPGPPPEAHELILRAAPTVAIAEPTASLPPWPERVVELPETTYVLHLGHRIKWLRLNKVEPRPNHGVQVRLSSADKINLAGAPMHRISMVRCDAMTGRTLVLVGNGLWTKSLFAVTGELRP